jgi:hypothetical protein
MEKYKEIIESNLRHRYMMLDRLRCDCEYYLNYGNRNEKVLWAQNVEDHINLMINLYDSFPESDKPQWITKEQIIEYGRKLKQ